MVLVELGRYDAAIEDLTRAIDLDPSLTLAWYHRSVAWFRQGNLAKAWADIGESQKRGLTTPASYLQQLQAASGGK